MHLPSRRSPALLASVTNAAQRAASSWNTRTASTTRAPLAVRHALQPRPSVLLLTLLLTAAACGPHARIPPRPAPLPAAAILSSADSNATLARRLAPVLYLQRDESFPLARVVAVVHPDARVIAYHLLWRDDAHGAWIPFTVPTDQEIVWVGYDASGAPVDVWTYWHTRILHTVWPRTQVAIDVQWGKHGSMPRGTNLDDLPRGQSLRAFWLAHQLGIADLLLSRLNRKGPLCFCHGPRRYRDFSRPLRLADRIDAVTVGPDPHLILATVFGSNYSRKQHWPWGWGPRLHSDGTRDTVPARVPVTTITTDPP